LQRVKKDDFQAIVSQIEGHNGILVNNSFESLEKGITRKSSFKIPSFTTLSQSSPEIWTCQNGRKSQKNSSCVGVSHFKSVSVLNQNR